MIERYKEKWKQHKWTVLRLIGIYLSIIFIDEWMLRKSLFKTMHWFIFDFDLVLMNLATVMLIASTLLMVTKRLFVTTVVMSNFLLVLGAINSSKYALRNVPLDIEDAFLVKEVLALMPQMANFQSLIILGILVVAMGILSFLLFKILKVRKISQHRVVFATLIVISVAVLGIGQMAYNSNLDIMKTGFLYHLSNHTRIKLPFDKAALKEADAQIRADIETYENNDATLSSYEKPNVIIIQSEAFWDINKMGLEMSENPIQYFDDLKTESIHGDMYVPVIGGGTSNTEFEILTGMTLKNFSSDWFMVYPNAIKSPIPSLATIFRHSGYRAIAIHPYMSWYYNRVEVYKDMGFDEFKSIEYMDHLELIGGYTSDKYTTDEIIKAIEENAEPVFNMTITMQNHGPYGNFRFEEDQIDVQVKTKLSNDSNYFLKNYVQGLYHSDIELKRLVKYLKESDEPTVILFYGDHLPMLGDDYLAYRESGYIGYESSSELQQGLEMMSVPYVLWSNYSQVEEAKAPMNASFMSAFLLEKLGVEMPNYMKVVSTISKEMPLILRTYAVNANGEKINPSEDVYKVALAKYHLLYKNWTSKKYDLNYSAWIDETNESYNQALNNIKIENAESSDQRTIITGQNFYQTMTLYINNTAVAFDFIGEHEVIVEKQIQKDDLLKMELLTDDGKLIAKSNDYQVDPLN
ncbi:LTA synthase family protein [Fusibacter sp. 3D3]|uniref:LTA synthase family protein n=1 Tax=Fusibacter sp. 3D3 TaxID=1048380 RepID=UPI000852B1A7|nr:LTA synthase family protein [Fusibacter sp. 3D3]GAU78112.1 Cyclic beta-1,2-glucan modification transmembrane protein [Fusibacter sp. 3D3]